MKKWLVIGLVALVATVCWAQYQTANYMEQGGAAWVIGNGGTLTIASGGTLTAASGSTIDINGGTWQGTIDGNWTAASQTCANLGTVTTADINGGTVDGAAIGGASASTGAFTTISGSGTFTLDDGSGASPSIVLTDATDEVTTISKADSGYTQITTAAADGVQIVTGNIKVGAGSPGQTINGEDAYVTGLLEVDGVIYADGGVSGAVNGTIGAGTPAAGAFTTVTASTSIKVDANGSTVSQINCGTTTIDAGTTGTTVSLTGCTASTRIFVCPVGDTGSAASFKATPGSGSFIVKSNADPSSCGVVVNWFAIK